jgi:hypothetical protein
MVIWRMHTNLEGADVPDERTPSMTGSAFLSRFSLNHPLFDRMLKFVPVSSRSVNGIPSKFKRAKYRLPILCNLIGTPWGQRIQGQT